VWRLVTGWTTRVQFPAGAGNISLFATASRPALGPNQPPTQWVSELLSPGVKRPVREADHLLPSGARVKNAWSYTSTHAIRVNRMVLS
jgi:hypothetical protein